MAEHAIDVDTDIVLAAGVYKADESDTATLGETLALAQAHVILAGSESRIKDVIADKGYHSTENLLQCETWGIRTYIPERDSPRGRKWTDKPSEHKQAVYNKRRRTKGERGRRLSKLRSEYVERSFAHVCETGGARRSWLHELENVTKRYLMYVAGKNLGVIMRSLFGMGKPRTLQTEGGGGCSSIWAVIWSYIGSWRAFCDHLALRLDWNAFSPEKLAALNGRPDPRRIRAAA